MWQELHWHPMIVHFPLALILTATACMVASRVAAPSATASSLAIVGSWNLIIGAVTALLAVGSGIGAAMSLHASSDASASISRHLYCAIASTVAVTFLAIWRGAGLKGTEQPSSAFLLLLTLASAAFVVTGYFGGENVYHYGVGVLGR